MIVAGYHLDLYCDKEGVVTDFHHGEVHTYTGQSRESCKRQAKKNGWMFHVDGTVSCPKCTGKGV